MKTIHSFATLLLLIGLGFFLFDLLYHFATTGTITVLSIEDVWGDIDKDNFESMRGMVEMAVPSEIVRQFVHMPAPTVLFVIAAIFYLPVKILSLLGVGKKEESR